MAEWIKPIADWDPIAAGTIVLAIATFILAIATIWLGVSTRGMSQATREMAQATVELARIEAARRAEEGRAALTIDRVASRSLGRVAISQSATTQIVVVRNTLPGEARDIRVFSREGDESGFFDRDRLAGLDSLELDDRGMTAGPVDLPASSDRFVYVEWTDATGRQQSPTYTWPEGRTGAPTVISRSTGG